MKNTKEFDFKRSRRVTSLEIELAYKAIKRKLGTNRAKLCKAINTKGKKCIVPATEGTSYCFRHKKK